ncbi:MAG: hypothetical protein KKA07_04735 [Bacteroidetes bacterium]|nr:hypothetical protein [Bacteroidota bacterium]
MPAWTIADSNFVFQLSLFDNDDWFRPFNKPETLSSLAAKYRVTYETFRKWLVPRDPMLMKIFQNAVTRLNG